MIIKFQCDYSCFKMKFDLQKLPCIHIIAYRHENDKYNDLSVKYVEDVAYFGMDTMMSI